MYGQSVGYLFPPYSTIRSLAIAEAASSVCWPTTEDATDDVCHRRRGRSQTAGRSTVVATDVWPPASPRPVTRCGPTTTSATVRRERAPVGSETSDPEAWRVWWAPCSRSPAESDATIGGCHCACSATPGGHSLPKGWSERGATSSTRSCSPALPAVSAERP